MRKLKVLYTGILVSILLFSACSSAQVAEKTGNPAVSAAAASAASDVDAHLFDWVGDRDYKSPRNATIDSASAVNQSKGLAADWYKDTTVYHIWMKSFNDYDGDGVGDFRGITAKLDYIQKDIGADTLWLSPIFDCSGKGTAEKSNMHGYDTIDYYSVNAYFGNEEHLGQLLAEAHKRGMKVIFDWVPNHTSSNHPWFLQSAKDEEGKGAWYLWNDVKLPWSPMGNANTWSFNINRQAMYYGAFNSGMPDLNFRNWEVREEMKNVVRYWLNKGFDGLRIDAVRYMIEDSGTGGQIDRPLTHEFFAELRKDVIDPYAALGSPKFMVAEAWINGERSRLEKYFGTAAAPEFQMLFDFDFSGQVYSAVKSQNTAVFSSIKYYADTASGPGGNKLAAFLSNHDNLMSRPGTLYTTPAQLALATALQLLSPAAPFIYYANEIGQADAKGYSGDDIRLRYKLDWALEAVVKAQADSILNLHKALNQARSDYPAIRRGSYGEVASPNPKVGAYTLSFEGKTVLCVFNLGAGAVEKISLTLAAAVPGNAVSPVIGTAAALADGKTVTLSNLKAYGFGVYAIGTDKGKSLYAY